ncbi:hypothetical protein D0T12_31410 [Actinomadura spongiicola]|uniref:Uncharacterized protein n=1 Tax=Actinomadura spongiicola TaxID=2303421 RepID=A0A372G7V0_9ACTN|nr:hypothetical protein D0T12_31410 [Actinomadura spongiicola]
MTCIGREDAEFVTQGVMVVGEAPERSEVTGMLCRARQQLGSSLLAVQPPKAFGLCTELSKKLIV